MRILALFQVFSFSSSTIYLDLLRQLVEEGHRVCLVAGTSEKEDFDHLHKIQGIYTAYCHIPDQFHAGTVKKGLIQLSIGARMLITVRRFFWKKKTDLIIYPTPPITLAGIIEPLKKHFHAASYLMLKDIFPQNAVDLGMMREGGPLHIFFRRMEEKLYKSSDFIGCMSEANVDYMRYHESGEIASRLELFPNTVSIRRTAGRTAAERERDEGRPVEFMFGGNMGEPQAVEFLMKCMERLSGFEGAHFTFCGDGTKAGYIKEFIRSHSLKNVSFHSHIPRPEYEKLLEGCDVGLISLSPDFTIPNYPSRILSYMQLSKPVLAATDRMTDIGELVDRKARCGWWCPSDDVELFVKKVEEIVTNRESIPGLGENGRRYLEENFDVRVSVKKLEEAYGKSRG